MTNMDIGIQIIVRPTQVEGDNQWMCSLLWQGKIVYQAYCPRLLDNPDDNEELAEKLFVSHIGNRLNKDDESFDMFTSTFRRER